MLIEDSKPMITVIIVARNEENYIEGLLKSLYNQTLDKDNYEIIFVDGMSEDNTVNIVNRFIHSYPNRMKLLKNNKKTLPPGWNMGIKAAKGNYILRIDGHTLITEDFLEQYINLIQKQPNVDCVGGIIESKGLGFQGEINEFIYSHPFGVGNSKFRTTKKVWEGFVDTVPYGAYKRSVFEKVGYFNEKLRRNEDIEFHKRMKNLGMEFYMSTSIKSTYYVRSTLKGLIQKSLGDGTWTMIADQSVPGSLRARHKAPLYAFLLGLLILILAIFFVPMRWILAIVGLAYLGAAAWASKTVIRQSGFVSYLYTIGTFFCLHFFRGLGCFKAYFTREFWYFRNKRKRYAK